MVTFGYDWRGSTVRLRRIANGDIIMAHRDAGCLGKERSGASIKEQVRANGQEWALIG